MASDNNPLAHIRDLVDEERELRARLQRKEISADEEHARLQALEVELDQCWDLLRQRRALRETGVAQLDGRMIDRPVVLQAQRILQRARS